jgi:hypothetical protein
VILVLLFSQPAQPVLAKLNLVSGAASDRDEFQTWLGECSAASPSFETLVDTLNNSDKTVTLNLGRAQQGVTIDAFGGGGTQTLNLSDFEKWPRPEKDPTTGQYSGPEDHPWAGTVCEELAHSLAEAYDAAANGHDYNAAHAVGFSQQNEIRHDLNQTDTARDAPGTTTTTYGTHTEEVVLNSNGNTDHINYRD